MIKSIPTLVVCFLLSPVAWGQGPIFLEDFNNGNQNGWTFGTNTEWSIGSATASAGSVYGNQDPGVDGSGTPGGGIAGVVIGGAAATNLHPFDFITSPTVDTTVIPNPTLFIDRYLNSDYLPFMQNTIEAWDGNAWQTLWLTGNSPGIMDSAWGTFFYDLTPYSNPALKVRFGFLIGNTGVFSVTSWNLDNVKIDVGPPPLQNDTCDAAVLNGVQITVGANVLGSNMQATTSGVIPPCGSNPGNDMWYLFISPQSCSLVMDTFGSGFDTVLTLRDATNFSPGNCGTLPILGCADDSMGLQSSLQVSLNGGQPILVQVSADNNSVGNLTINVTPVFSLSIAQALSGGPLQIQNQCGVANRTYLTPITLNPGSFPAGWLFGVDIPISALLFEMQFGPPFLGQLDSTGSSTFTIPPGLPSGLTLQAVSVLFDSNGLPLVSSTPVAFTTL